LFLTEQTLKALFAKT